MPVPSVQAGLFESARAFRDANIVDVTSFDELKDAISAGKWARGPWAGAAFHPASSEIYSSLHRYILAMSRLLAAQLAPQH